MERAEEGTREQVKRIRSECYIMNTAYQLEGQWGATDGP